MLPIGWRTCKFGGTSEKFWPKAIQFCRQKLNPARETVPFKSGQVDRDIRGEGKVDLGKGEENMNGCGDDVHNRWTRQGIMGSG
jgi:hypothetical protein